MSKNRKAPVKAAKIKDTSISQYWLAGVLLLTFIAFFPSLHNALTNWDDPRYLTDNPLIRSLSATNLKRIFTESYFGNYQPLHIFSYALEYQLYKLNPVGYHTTSVIMHLIVTGLVYRFIFLLSENVSIALITAMLFGIHPLHVESVAWAAERKDVLYAMFFLGSLIQYLLYIKREEKVKHLIFAFILFLLSIGSKAMASSLPPVLILIDIFMRRKWKIKLVWEKIPFFLLTFVFGYISLHIVSETGQTSLNVFSLPERILIANFNILTYVYKLILPIDLSAFYPYPARVDGNLPSYFFFAPVVVTLLLILVIKSFKKAPVLFFGAGFFVACIFLVLQLLPVGPTIISERYSYLPSIGFFFVIAFYFQKLIKEKPSFLYVGYTVLIGYCIFLFVATRERCTVWKDSITLWSNVLDQFPHVGTALNNRGNIYGKEKGDLDRAMEDFNNSIKYDPNYQNSYVNRGVVYCIKGKFDLAIQDFNKALELKPKDFEAMFNRGIAFAQVGKFDNAIADFTSLEKESPDDKRIFISRGRAFANAGRYEEALKDVNRAIEVDPSQGDAFYLRASIYYNLKKFQDAYNDTQTATNLGITIDPNFLNTIKQAVGVNP